jgi:hypothetical protein
VNKNYYYIIFSTKADIVKDIKTVSLNCEKRLLLRFLDVSGSNLGQDIGYRD